MSPCRLVSVLFPLAAAVFSHAQEQPVHELKLHWEPGQFYLQETDTETTTSLTALGQKHDQTLRMRQTTSIRVSAASDQTREVKVTIDSLKGELLQDGLLNPFDAARIEEALPVLQKSVGHAAGKTFTMVYDPQDQFQNVRDIGSLLKPGQDEPDLNQIADAKQVATLYRRSLELGLPKIAVRPGDKWISDETMSFPEAGPVQVRLHAKFESIEERGGRPQARISFQGSMETQKDTGTKRSITLGPDSKLSGHVLFDLERRTVSLSFLLGELNLGVNGKKLPVRQQVTTRLVAMRAAGGQ
ncbi:MAG: hypothetical protein JNG86_21395 [Verrucomicrobiaceae bacterium]|nr:hypothetical protein [Verrucomicrobiaceae bacterium]